MISIGFTSCESDAYFEVPDGESKLFAFSEINTEDLIEVKVNTSIGINTDDRFYFPGQEGANVTLYKDGVPLDNPGFRYISSKAAFVSLGSFRPETNAVYGLHVELTDKTSKIKEIYAETSIPVKDTLSNVLIEKIDESHIRVSCGFKNLENEYFMLIPKFKSYQGAFLRTEISDIENTNVSLRSIINENKLLISKAELEEDLIFEVTSDEVLTGNLLDIELRSITKEAYKYYEKYSLEVVSQSISVSEPIIRQTNFENGLGLFTGYAKSSASFLIN
ncbi:DUF4249 family protein [Portibacter lacus]|nr:DUF4249 family protein [Portibacter lacus]